MKIDIFNMNEVQIGKETLAPKGRLRLLCSAPCAVYLTAQGYEVLAGVGQEIDLTYSEPVTFRVDAPEGARAFFHCPQRSILDREARGMEEVFTNADRMVHQSGTMAEIQRGLREVHLAQHFALQEIRRETHKLQQLRKASAAPAETPAEKPEEKPKADIPAAEEPAE